ncbi:hypothetical protein Q3G72_012166 [Acer saccharum]|nr:hypothetical protein Q3G72_012166 [Acer saccharum]
MVYVNWTIRASDVNSFNTGIIADSESILLELIPSAICSNPSQAINIMMIIYLVRTQKKRRSRLILSMK